MGRIENSLKKGEKNLIAYLTAGDPCIEKTPELVFAMERGGAALVEIGIPYSDPLADGPVIQAASTRALSKDISIQKIFDAVTEIRKESQIPLVFLVYYNTIHNYGGEEFLKKCEETGVDGLIIPDLPMEEQKELPKNPAVSIIPLVALNSEDRIESIVKDATGFVYCISSFGVTGTRDTISNKASEIVSEIKKYTDIPVALGFGISHNKMVEDVNRYADAAIVGSAIVKVIEKTDGSSKEVEDFVASLLK
ncbi:tryptophan synthase subunit alpha [uncultured Ilyobacter sp.]|uniref:tryptophan synthase subunit alpha n=1 Tax=uncultured Ilyobacter sp. TaxID=544433 RepID=UPI0029C0C4AB|nr:tryptophan synthase subunit alpha [uncultured Ilyobacter sp.]